MNKTAKVIMVVVTTLLTALYVISPDPIPGPLDDAIVALLDAVLARRLLR